MFSFLKKFYASKPIFTTSIEWYTMPPNTFCLSGYLDSKKIGRANGDYQTSNDFRIVTIDVFEPSLRSKGYGSKMINRLISEAKKLGCNEFVFVGVSAVNTSAADLYKTRFNAAPRAILNCNDKNDYVRSLA